MDMKLHPRFDELFQHMTFLDRYEDEEMSGNCYQFSLKSDKGFINPTHAFTLPDEAIDTKIVKNIYKHFNNFVIDHVGELINRNVGYVHVMKPYLADKEMDINPVNLTLVDDYSDVNHTGYLDEKRKLVSETNQHNEMIFNVLSENEGYKLTLFDFFNKVILRGKEQIQISQTLLKDWFPSIDVMNDEIAMMKIDNHQKYTTTDRPDKVNAAIQRDVKLIIISGDKMHGIRIIANVD